MTSKNFEKLNPEYIEQGERNSSMADEANGKRNMNQFAHDLKWLLSNSDSTKKAIGNVKCLAAKSASKFFSSSYQTTH